MANGRNGRKAGSGRDAGGFVALPWAVLDCHAYSRLSHPARSLLLELARQYVGDNNGRLLSSAAYLAKRGWKSCDVITRAKRELLEHGFIFETVKGQRPNRASWYAITWQRLDKIKGYDYGAAESYVRSAYLKSTPLKNESLEPSGGAMASGIAPSHGAAAKAPAPSHGSMGRGALTVPAPSRGDHLEVPSPVLQLPRTADMGAGSLEGVEGQAQAVLELDELWRRVGCRSTWRLRETSAATH